jgi:alpha-tubulin suppressor-like RCC1 family protein
MRFTPAIALALLFLLSGCGTLKIDVEYGNTPASTNAESPPSVPAATQEATCASTDSSSVGVVPSSTAEGIASPQAKDPYIAVAVGRDFTCAATLSGRVRCWGNNTHGQLGDGTRVNSNIPVTVDGITDARAVTAGWGHACALTASGGVKCWGYNADGELGDGGTAGSGTPVDAAGLSSGVAAIDAGDFHTCAVTGAHALKCWGKNSYGQLGDWTKNSAAAPVESPFFGGGVADVAAGWGHTCVQTTEGWAKCWGNNAYGQMGFGKQTDIHLPAEDVVNLNGRVLKVSAEGNQTCALTAGGGVQCWGDNRYGQLGDGTVQKRYEPAQVAGLISGVSDVETGWFHACAVVGGGELQCWGWNFYGQLGDGTTLNRSVPARVQYLTDGVKDIAVGWGHTCVVTEFGAVKCWGLNGSGQLGDGTWTDSRSPLTVLEPVKIPAPARTTTVVPDATPLPGPTPTLTSMVTSSALP